MIFWSVRMYFFNVKLWFLPAKILRRCTSVWYRSVQPLSIERYIFEIIHWLSATKATGHTTVGKLRRLWAWAKLLDIEDGNIGRLPAQEIADIMRWRKSAKTLVEAMLELRFLEQSEDGAYWIHGWYELNGKSTEKARKDRERKA